MPACIVASALDLSSFMSKQNCLPHAWMPSVSFRLCRTLSQRSGMLLSRSSLSIAKLAFMFPISWKTSDLSCVMPV